MEMYRRTFAEISVENLIANWNEIKKTAGSNRFICPMVKANAYGHGDIQVAQTLEHEGADTLGVCLIEEGLLLRASGLKSQILVFRGFDKHGAQKILEYQMTPVVSTWQQLQILESVADDPVKVHLKFNTGMNRLGFDLDQSEQLHTFFKNSKKLKLKAVLTHLAQGEDAISEIGFSAKQIEAFLPVVEHFKSMNVYSHILNSGGIASLAEVSIQNKEHRYLHRENWGFRPGLALYGYQAAGNFSAMTLRPVMTLKSVVNNIRSIKSGESVSYGCSWVAKRDSKIAVVPIGYADGFHRLISNKGAALFADKMAPVVGRICMDFLMLDVTDIIGDDDPLKWIEEEVVFFGYNEKGNLLSAEQVSQLAQTITWETLTSVGERVPRHFKGLKKL
ncbi:MAG: alanine racemase [Bdellovibrionales bacterium RIFCSPHIGHO2_01_FULL_40_29]|nr:MAG: alanine racemase [Bdellovibrionales bacterium RIFCSPHIGHO2_01_FULL_40_29]OFZ33980.1 MAG: alanine racemase [Bdellovibrionales bacterium RIFCSPHIGHO2_02_FULL_40_15]